MWGSDQVKRYLQGGCKQEDFVPDALSFGIRAASIALVKDIYVYDFHAGVLLAHPAIDGPIAVEMPMHVLSSRSHKLFAQDGFHHAAFGMRMGVYHMLPKSIKLPQSIVLVYDSVKGEIMPALRVTGVAPVPTTPSALQADINWIDITSKHRPKKKPRTEQPSAASSHTLNATLPSGRYFIIPIALEKQSSTDLWLQDHIL